MKTQNNLTKPTQKLVNTNTRKPKISSISILNSTSISQSHPEPVEGSTSTSKDASLRYRLILHDNSGNSQTVIPKQEIIFQFQFRIQF